LAKPKPIVLAAVSDTHCNSKLGLCPPEGVRVGGGAQYIPGPCQVWLWECWETYWQRVADTVKASGARLWVLFNGDLVDGDHHSTVQIISKNLEHQSYILKRAFGLPLGLKPERVGVVRGTAAHVGEEGSSEESMARTWAEARHAVHQSGNEWSHYLIRWRAHGSLIDARHHGRAGGRPWTQHGAAGNLSRQVALEHLDAGEGIPDICLRSHKHTFADSGEAVRPRVIQLPAFQLLTDYATQVVPEAIADIGGVVALFAPGAAPVVQVHRWRPRLPEAT
jgi:hypothetical protein